jgi:hypothetical protein
MTHSQRRACEPLESLFSLRHAGQDDESSCREIIGFPFRIHRVPQLRRDFDRLSERQAEPKANERTPVPLP